MTTLSLNTTTVLVVGAGIMGAGIAQVAAQSGQSVLLYDTRADAAAQAKSKLAATFDGLVNKGKMDSDAASAALARITPIDSLTDAAALSQVGLVVEAIVEDLQAKRGLFQQLEGVLPAGCVMATNTSSISVTAIANGLKRPEQLVGMHFFNPVPLMKLVEVVSGLATEPAIADAIFALSKSWGKVPVHAKSTPGFIVNRIARPYYAEALALLQEQAAKPVQIDACLRAAGFRMGPCELMDLIGHDTNFSVTRSVYEANFYDKRYVPSLVQREMVDGGLLGRKSGRGFYTYPAGAPAPTTRGAVEPVPIDHLIIYGEGSLADWLDIAVQSAVAAGKLQVAAVERQRLAEVQDPVASYYAAQQDGAAGQAGAEQDADLDDGDDAELGDWTAFTGLSLDGVCVAISDGRSAAELALELGEPDVIVIDMPVRRSPQGAAQTGQILAFASAPYCSDEALQIGLGALSALGFDTLEVDDTPGLVVARTIAMLINEAADAVHQGVCTPEGADAAMKLGVNYPAGPFEWLHDWNLATVIDLLDELDATYRGERYRVSPWLKRQQLRGA